jgi:hypothetical protein
VRKEWLVKIKRVDPQTGKDWQPGKFDVLCSAHFVKEDFCNLPWMKNRLKPDSVPSIFSHCVSIFYNS